MLPTIMSLRKVVYFQFTSSTNESVTTTRGNLDNFFRASWVPFSLYLMCLCCLNTVLTPWILVIARCQHVDRGSIPPSGSETQRYTSSNGCNLCSKTLAPADVSNFVPNFTALVMQDDAVNHNPDAHWDFKIRQRKRKIIQINNILISSFWSYFHLLGQQAIMSRLFHDPYNNNLIWLWNTSWGCKFGTWLIRPKN